MKKLALSVVIAAMAAGCTTVAAKPARYMTDEKGNHIRLTEEACTSEAGALAQIPTTVRPKMKAASVYWDGKNYAACWMPYDGQYEFIIDETGDAGTLPKRALKRETEV